MNTDDKTALFYITSKGKHLCEKLLPLFSNPHICHFNQQTVIDMWQQCDSLVFVMATGIVVRTLSPLIQDKKTDPAVVVLDEKGQFVISLLGGHLAGANTLSEKIAAFLNAQPVITTASDVNDKTALDLWAEANELYVEGFEQLKRLSRKLIETGALNIYLDAQLKHELPDDLVATQAPSRADILVTNKQKIESQPNAVYMRPKNLIIGIGCNSGTTMEEISKVLETVFSGYNLSLHSICGVATIDKKTQEPGIQKFIAQFNLPLYSCSAQELNAISAQYPWIERSEAAYKAVGAYAVAEPAAISAACTDHILVQKQKIGNVTLAVSQAAHQKPGKLYIVGTGPGEAQHITAIARRALNEADVIVGYNAYVNLIKDIVKGKPTLSTGMTQEVDRCQKAIELAASGKTVALVSGGDPGIYGMAGLVLELLKNTGQEVEVRVIPGISALNAGGALLGAPLIHDFAVISLSDRLTDWETIELRLKAAAESDFVIVLYNPKSKRRISQIEQARQILLQHRHANTPVGIVRAAMRDGENVILTTLNNMLTHEIDMQTTIFIGNTQSFIWKNWIVTPRGYEKRYASKFAQF